MKIRDLQQQITLNMLGTHGLLLSLSDWKIFFQLTHTHTHKDRSAKFSFFILFSLFLLYNTYLFSLVFNLKNDTELSDKLNMILFVAAICWKRLRMQ